MSTWLTAGALFLSLFLLYASTAAPEVTFHDSGELITGACTLGIPHPPGSPVWCLLGRVFSLVPFGSPAWRINVMSGFFAALTCAFTYLVVLEILKPIDGKPLAAWWRHAAGVFSALLLAQSPAFWEKAVQAELYALNVFFFVAILFMFSKWFDLEAENNPRHRRMLVWIAVMFALGAGNYLAILYYAPVILIAVLARRPSLLRDWKLALLSGVAFCLVFLCAYLYLPVRSLADPPIDWGNPETLPGFKSVMLREYWGRFSFSCVSGEFVTRWLQSLAFREQFGVVPLLLAAGGLFLAGAARKLMTLVLVACFYVYGAVMMLMQAATPVLSRDLQYVGNYGLQEFHIPLYLTVALFAGPGFYAVVRFLANRTAAAGMGPATRIAVTVVLAGILAMTFTPHFRQCNYRDFRQPHEFGLKVLESVPNKGRVFACSDNALFVLTYLKFCERVREDVLLVTPSPAFWPELAAMTASTNGALSSRETLSLLNRESGGNMERILNQKEAGDAGGDVVFVKFPPVPNLERHVHPDGMVFRLNSDHKYEGAAQFAFWVALLDQAGFALRVDSKTDFRENMVYLLHDHAWWHDVAGEYETAKFLYLRALEYSPSQRADLLSGAAACMLGLGELSSAVEYGGKAAALNPGDRRALETMGIASAGLGRHDVAAECFRKMLEMRPDDAAARKNLDTALRNAEKGRKKAGSSGD